jgi:two-component system, chemotaxis family, protein-glutamate methylesterase/glutaminase
MQRNDTAGTPEKVIRVLVVDDSAYVRKAVNAMLSRSPFLEVVGTARDGRDALAAVEELKPDVVVLDLIMPELDGVGFLREQMAKRPVPAVVLSIASDSGEEALAALDVGAIDFVQKPTALATEKLYEVGDELIQKVKMAAAAPVSRSVGLAGQAKRQSAVHRARNTQAEILVIGVSTGGPQALNYLIPQFPPDFPVPVAIVLHMPIGYTELYARRLNAISLLHVREARHGEELAAGAVLIAPAGRHLSFKRREDRKVFAHLDARPFDAPHRPSVDVLFQSAAEVFGDRVLAVVMSGMGSDGRDGAAAIKAQGGLVITEAEESCVVYGMPRAVVEAGLSDASARLDRMAEAILEHL